MNILPQRQANETDGDFARRRARFTSVVFLALLAGSIWIFAGSEQIWFKILPLEGGIFLIASAIFGTVMASLPVLAVVFLLLSVWYGVESVFRPRSQATPTVDKLIIAAGLLVWFSPALALVAGALRAVITGSVAFTRPQRVYMLETDPIAFWQSIGFFMIVAAALAYPAYAYWRAKFARGTEVV